MLRANRLALFVPSSGWESAGAFELASGSERQPIARQAGTGGQAERDCFLVEYLMARLSLCMQMWIWQRPWAAAVWRVEKVSQAKH